MILAGCTVVVEEPDRPGRPQICTMEHRPVCARSDGRLRSFSNACMARAAGYRVVHPGACRRQSGQAPGPRICTREYRPVCARRGDGVRTFANACLARAEGYAVLEAGAC